jgi:hypothetical protein
MAMMADCNFLHDGQPQPTALDTLVDSVVLANNSISTCTIAADTGYTY